MKKLAMITVVLGAVTAAHADFLYAVNDGNNILERIDLNTLTVSAVGALGASGDFGDLAWGGNGTMYWLAGRGNNSLYSVNTGTGAATFIGSHGINDLFGLGFNYADGNMYASQFSGGDDMVRINTSNASTTFLANVPGGMSGQTYVPSIGLVGMQAGAGDLYSIATNGSVALLHDGAFINDCDIAYDPSRNVIWAIDWSGDLYKYDLNAGYARTLVLSGLGAHDGLEYMNPVPEPASLIALAAGAAALARRRRRKA